MNEGYFLNESRNRLVAKLQDSANQFFQFKYIYNIEKIKTEISQTEFKSLEEIIGKDVEELEQKYPNICDKYNKLVEEFRNANFSVERIEEIFNEVYKITHP